MAAAGCPQRQNIQLSTQACHLHTENTGKPPPPSTSNATQRNAPARSTMCSRLLRMWEVPYWSTVLLCSRQVKTLQQARGAGDGQGHRGRGAEEVSGSGQVSTGAAWGQTPGMTTSVRLCCRTFETPKHAQHAPSAHNAQHAPFPTHLCDRLDRSFMFVSPTRRLACPVRSRATTSSTAGREGRNEAGRHTSVSQLHRQPPSSHILATSHRVIPVPAARAVIAGAVHSPRYTSWAVRLLTYCPSRFSRTCRLVREGSSRSVIVCRRAGRPGRGGTSGQRPPAGAAQRAPPAWQGPCRV
jgi:hypothetical protein